jgi:hypothetical protein
LNPDSLGSIAMTNRHETVRRAVELGARARLDDAGRGPEDAWDDAWQAIGDEFAGAPSHTAYDVAQASVLDEFTHRGA